MRKKVSGNILASVRQRLLNKARNDGRSFNELLQYFAMERFLYRLSKSRHVDGFVLKGALMLRAWRSPEFRPTMDVDMLIHHRVCGACPSSKLHRYEKRVLFNTID